MVRQDGKYSCGVPLEERRAHAGQQAEGIGRGGTRRRDCVQRGVLADHVRGDARLLRGRAAPGLEGDQRPGEAKEEDGAGGGADVGFRSSAKRLRPVGKRPDSRACGVFSDLSSTRKPGSGN